MNAGAKKDDMVPGPASRAKGRYISREEEAELSKLACELGASADRMAQSLDRAIAAARNALDPAREAAFRERCRAEIAADRETVVTGLF